MRIVPINPGRKSLMSKLFKVYRLRDLQKKGIKITMLTGSRSRPTNLTSFIRIDSLTNKKRGPSDKESKCHNLIRLMNKVCLTQRTLLNHKWSFLPSPSGYQMILLSYSLSPRTYSTEDQRRLVQGKDSGPFPNRPSQSLEEFGTLLGQQPPF